MRMNFRIVVVVLALISLFSANSAIAAGEVRDARLWTAPDHSRLVFDLSSSVEYRVFRLHSPERVVIDISNASLKTDFGEIKLPDPVVQLIRYGSPKPKVLRVVLEVKEEVNPRSFLLKPMQGKPHRLVVDLMRKSSDEAEHVVTAEQVRSRKEVVIAVDAGHGGEDPGAIGKYGLQEKHVTLAVAKELAERINRHSGMRAVLIRKGDYFVPLKKRVELVRNVRADLMVSIHADAVRDRSVEGASVYTLSETGATPDKVASALAARENAADAVGGSVIEEVDDPMVSMILGDMGKRESLNSALLLAETIIKDVKRVGPIKYTDPKRARFVVLGALETPSVLVEVDYISNPSREKKLKSSSHQRKLADAIYSASLAYLKQQGRLSDRAAVQMNGDTTSSRTVMLANGDF